ncbi:hypothetical protein POVWA1_069540 [Plasmodium ovale wallikeri]|uniref:PIR Superfamily Protein n=1 Tax=Plasmodium ovale wallikeri TaxID=864142 RepID=A0A1A9AGU2_PLAOA|nr:hypothetical protein POVWA1_069540 [Plasmodium ovale wallikeri]
MSNKIINIKDEYNEYTESDNKCPNIKKDLQNPEKNPLFIPFGPCLRLRSNKYIGMSRITDEEKEIPISHNIPYNETATDHCEYHGTYSSLDQ